MTNPDSGHTSDGRVKRGHQLRRCQSSKAQSLRVKEEEGVKASSEKTARSLLLQGPLGPGKSAAEGHRPEVGAPFTKKRKGRTARAKKATGSPSSEER